MPRSARAIVPYFIRQQTEEEVLFQRMLFAKIVPNCKKLGLLDGRDSWLRERFQEIGVIEFEDYVDTSVEYSTGMKCAIISATATVSGVPAAGNTASAACDVASFAEDGLGAVPGFACGLLGDFVATGSGVAAAGASAATGPGAVAVGVSTYRYLAATGEIVCGALFDDGAYDFGVQLESDHEARVAYDVVNLGMCLRQETRFGVLSWSAADC